MKKRLAYSPGRLVAILTFGVFGIINTEMASSGLSRRSPKLSG